MSEFNQTDSMVGRDRLPRAVVAVGGPFLIVFLSFLIGAGLFTFFDLPTFIGAGAGLFLGGFGAIWLFCRSYVTNPAITAFMTVDPLVALIGGEDPHVTYGPGFHFAYPWEQRDAGNTVSLAEAAENFEVKIAGPTGGFTLKYSARLRPDIRRIPEFLGGVASVASDLGDLISAEIIAVMANKPVQEALLHVPPLNESLRNKFAHGETQGSDVTGFEERFGVIIGDVTIGEITPSKEVEETMSAVTESAIIDEMVYRSFGFKSTTALRKAIESGTVKAEEVDRRRHQAMAMSGNLQGMDLKEQTFNLRVQGLDNVDPGLVSAITAMAPAVAAALTKTTGSGGGTSKPARKTATKGGKKGGTP
jgi:hypothetical protein